jgi:hypothetical protein
MGHYQAVASSIAVPGLSLRVLQKGLGMSIDEINAMVPDVQKSIRNQEVHWYNQVQFIYTHPCQSTPIPL